MRLSGVHQEVYQGHRSVWVCAQRGLDGLRRLRRQRPQAARGRHRTRVSSSLGAPWNATASALSTARARACRCHQRSGRVQHDAARMF